MSHLLFRIFLGGLLFGQAAFSAYAQRQFCAAVRLRNAPQFEDQDKFSALTVGDFNGDGRPDLALTLNDNFRQNYVVLIRLNNGANGFNAPLTFTVEANPLAIGAGDFNGDGRGDLVVAHRSSGEFLRFYQGQGNGAFTAGAQLALTQPQDIAAITSVDLTGDGRPELIVQSDNFRDENQVITPFVNVLRNNGGTFSTGARFDGKGAIAADFNGDGRLDLALTRGDSLRILAGRGDATFGAELNQATPLREAQHSLTAGDFNGDGKMDVAATTSTNSGGQVVVLTGNGAGDFTDRLTVTDVRSFVQLVRALRTGGRTDLVVADETAATYLTNNGAINGAASFRRDNTVLAPGLRDTAVADFNGDGREDFVTLTQTVTLLINNGSGGFTDAPLVTEPRNSFLKIALGDLNGDGPDDLAALEAPNQLTILRGDSAGRFARAQKFTLGDSSTDVLIADFNRDGRRDVAALSGTGVSVFLNNGNVLGAATNFNAGADPRAFTAFDYDADGRTDLAVTLNNQSTVSLMRGNSSGAFETPRNVALPANGVEIISADFNGDGRGDLFIAAGNNRGYALTSNGDGSFTERGSYDIGGGSRQLALGDFNGDGRTDVTIGSATPSSAASDIVVLTGNGNGAFTATPRVELGNNHAPLAVADLNSDGRSDLVLSNVRDSLLLLVGDGAGRFPFNQDRDGLAFPRSYFALGGAINDLVSKDLNADGFPDFVLAGRGLTVLYGSCLRTATPLAAFSAASYTAPLAPDLIGAAFGTRLATTVARGGTNPPPTNLGGTTGTIFDSAGVLHPLPLFYVSSGQVNFLTPRNVALGSAELRISSGDGAYAVGNVAIANFAPGIFTANGNSLGVAAGVALRVRSNGAQVFENILQFNGSSYVPLPIDLSSASEPVFLVLFGTGFRNRNNATVAATIGGTNAEVTFAGAQGALTGLDQLNVRLPRSLIGRGVMNVNVTVGNQAANTVQIQIK